MYKHVETTYLVIRNKALEIHSKSLFFYKIRQNELYNNKLYKFLHRAYSCQRATKYGHMMQSPYL